MTLSNWKKKLRENGSKAFGTGDELKEKKDKIAKVERMVDQKEVEVDDSLFSSKSRTQMNNIREAPITTIKFNPDSEDPIEIQEEKPFGQITPVMRPGSPPPKRFDVELSVDDEEKERLYEQFKNGDEARLVIEAVGYEDPFSFPGRRDSEREGEEEDFNVIFSVEDEDAEEMLNKRLGR